MISEAGDNDIAGLKCSMAALIYRGVKEHRPIYRASRGMDAADDCAPEAL